MREGLAAVESSQGRCLQLRRGGAGGERWVGGGDGGHPLGPGRGAAALKLLSWISSITTGAPPPHCQGSAHSQRHELCPGQRDGTGESAVPRHRGERAEKAEPLWWASQTQAHPGLPGLSPRPGESCPAASGAKLQTLTLHPRWPLSLAQGRTRDSREKETAQNEPGLWSHTDQHYSFAHIEAERPWKSHSLLAQPPGL